MTEITNIMPPFTSIGKSVPRRDALGKVTGYTRYAGDISVPGLLHARLVVSPYAHALIASIDISAALKIPGVKFVYTSTTLGLRNDSRASRGFSPLASQEVLWCGHPVAIVLAESEAAAEDGVQAVKVEYELLPAVIDPLAALSLDAPRARVLQQDAKLKIADDVLYAPLPGKEEELSSNVTDKRHLSLGNIADGWREAEVVVERTFRTSIVHQSYLEPQSIVVIPDRNGCHLTIWPSSQGLFSVRSNISASLQLPERQITVESISVGGAFGGKIGLIEPLAAAASYTSRCPVHLVYTRSMEFSAANPAPQSVIDLKLGVKRDGTLVALEGRIVFGTGAYASADVVLGGIVITSTYRCPHIDLRCYEVLTNKVSVGPYRAPGAPQATFALESLIDEICQILKIDPLDFRLQNALKDGDSTLDQHIWKQIGLLECLEKAQIQPLWANRRMLKMPPAGLENWKIGIGLAAGGWPGGTRPAAAACRLEKDGSITVVIGGVDLAGSDTSLELIAAQCLGVSPTSVTVAHDNTDSMPYAGDAGDSKTIYTIGAAVLSAARDARDQILSIASDMLETAPEDLEIKGESVVVRGVPGKNIALAAIARASIRFAGKYEPVYGLGRSANRIHSPMYTVHIAKVAVDPETGEVCLLDYTAIQDVGFAINPALVEGQIHGGVTQGLGWALFERIVYDKNGQLLTSNLMDYALPHSFDIPQIQTVLVEIPSDLGPFGAKGVGEPPVVPVAAAISNAVFDAVGVRMMQLPITAESLCEAMQGIG